MIPLAQSPAASKVDRAVLMHTGDEVDSQFHPQGDQEIGAVEAIGQQDGARLKPVEQLPQQCRFARFFPFVRPDRHVHEHPGGQRE